MTPMRSIAHYRLGEKLGEGGMGAVYRAHDTKLGRDVAIKVLPPALASDADYIARFQREAQVLASLNHPNIAAIYGLEENAIVMELVEGSELKGPLRVDEAVRIAKQIADALEAAHERGIIHRDLKPANIRITPDGTVKVLDFGLAKATEPANATSASVANSPTLTIHATTAGMILGTAAYMSPEQATGKPVDRRADIWALGAVFAELLTGKRVFDGETVSEILAAVILKEPDLNGVPDSVRPVIERCLRRDIRRRWQAVGDVRIALDEPVVRPTAVTSKAKRWPLVTAAAFACLAAPAAWLLKPSPEPPLLEFEVTAPQGFTMGPVTWGQLAVSPDGERLAFTAADNGGRRVLFVREFRSGAVTQIASSDGAFGPVWAPDSRGLAFFASGNLRKVDTRGGAPQSVTQAKPEWASWSESGEILFSEGSRPLQRVRLSTGDRDEPLPLDGATKETYQAAPAFLPGGNGFVYSSWSSKPGCWYARPDGTRRELLSPHITAPLLPASDRDGRLWLLTLSPLDLRLIARRFDARHGEFVGAAVNVSEHRLMPGPTFSASRTGVLAFRTGRWQPSRLTWFSRDGRELSRIQAEPSNSPRLSPDGKSLIWLERDRGGKVGIWRSTAGNAPARLMLPEAVTVALFPVWSADGRDVYYLAIQPGRQFSIRRAAVQGGNEGVFQDRAHNFPEPTSASRDGKWLVISNQAAGLSSTFVIDTANPARETQILRDETSALGVALSPDGLWMAYSALSDGVRQVFVRAAPAELGGPQSSNRYQISRGGGSYPVWRSDGRELFYLNPESKLVAVPVHNTADGFQAGASVPLFQTRIAQDERRRDYDVSPDGQRFVVAEPIEGADTPITVLYNWPKLLEGK